MNEQSSTRQDPRLTTEQTKMPAGTEQGSERATAGGMYGSGQDLTGGAARGSPGAAGTATHDPYGGSGTMHSGKGQFDMQGQGDVESQSSRQGQQGMGSSGRMQSQSSSGMQQGFNQGGTGADNNQFDLVSVLYHALEGGATYQKYVQDAEQQGDQDLAQFFRDVQKEEQQRAMRAQQLLGQRLAGAR
jgi:hypothetical protein